MFQAKIDGKASLTRDTSSGKNIAILGVRKVAADVYENISAFTAADQQVVGFIYSEPFSQNGNGKLMPDTLGSVEDMREIVHTHRIEKVLLAVDPNDIERMHQLVQRCELENVAYELLPKSYVVNYGDITSDIEEGGKSSDDYVPKELWFQRPLDFLISLALFLLFLPSWVFIAIAIKLESKGTILYSQERVGESRKLFRIYKFRSMYSDAEKRGVPQLATQNDPRITKVGLFLRKTRLDELPQLVNIIRGDMSLIGPRPERPYFVEKYSEDMPAYPDRLKVKPGLTGHAQVETGYDETIEDVRIKLQHDLYYIENRDSAKLYFKIWLKTVWVVLTAKGQ